MDVRAQRPARAVEHPRRRHASGRGPFGRAILALVVVLATLAALAGPAGAHEPRRPADPDRPPAGYELSANRAIAAAERSPRVREQLRARPDVAPSAYTRGGGRWQVSWFRDRDEQVQAHLDDRTRRVLEVWTGPQVSWEMARGYEGAFGRRITAPYVWIPLCLAFLLPFVDPRRPLRLVHLDLLVLLAFSASHFFFNGGEIYKSVPLVYPVLLYLAGRMLCAGLRPRSRAGPLVPLLPMTALALALVFVVGFRVTVNLVDSNVIDVGYAGVIGADRVVDGTPLYEGDWPADNIHGDTYGPAAYLAYVPFEQVLPWSGRWDDLPAAHAAAILFDLGTVVALGLLGRRLRPGREGTALGIALAYGWAAYPYTAFALNSNTNDTLVALLLALALLAAASAPARGALVALAGLTKFAPLALAPLLAAGTGERRARSMVLFGGTFAVVVVALVLPFVPDGGLAELSSRTLGNQVGRESPFSVWGQYPTLAPLQVVVGALAVVLGVAVAFVPRRRSIAQVAALGAAVLLLLQLAATHWFYLYVVWFAPFVLVALFAEHRSTFAAGAASHAPAASAPGQSTDTISGSMDTARPSSAASTSTALSRTSSSEVSRRTGM